jgi:WD40 repeat protein
MRLWDTERGEEVRRFDDVNVFDGPSLAFIPGGDRVIAGDYGGLVRIWDINSGEEVHRFSVRGPVLGVAVSPNGEFALTSSKTDNAVLLWKLPS